MQQPGRVDVRWEWINQGWEMYQKQLGNWIVIALVVFLISLIPIVPMYIFLFASAGLGSQTDPQDIAGLMRSMSFSIVTQFVMNVMGWFLGAFAYSGYYHTAMKQLRGEQISIADFFSGLQHFVPMLGVTALLGILQFVGNLFCCLGFIFQLVTLGLLIFTYPLIVERKLNPIEAIKASLEVTKQNAPMFILFGIVAHLVGFAGIVVCCVGLIFTAPLLFTTVACAYRDCFGTPGGYDSYEPPPPPIYGGYEPPPPPPPSSWQ